MTRPRRLLNQRLAMMEASTSAVTPLPLPTTTPHSSTSCHGSHIKGVSATPDDTITSATAMVRRRPNRSMIAAANGPARPYSRMLTATAKLMVARDQPNSASNGTISTPGTERMPAATSSTRKVQAATVQAGWMRRVMGGVLRVAPEN